MIGTAYEIANALIAAIRNADATTRAVHVAGVRPDPDFCVLITVSPWEYSHPKVQMIVRDAEAAGFAMFYEHGDVDIVRASLLTA